MNHTSFVPQGKAVAFIKSTASDSGEWVYCPICENRTRIKIRKDTVLKHFPLYCPKCRKVSLIDAEGTKITVID